MRSQLTVKGGNLVVYKRRQIWQILHLIILRFLGSYFSVHAGGFVCHRLHRSKLHLLWPFQVPQSAQLWGECARSVRECTLTSVTLKRLVVYTLFQVKGEDNDSTEEENTSVLHIICGELSGSCSLATNVSLSQTLWFLMTSCSSFRSTSPECSSPDHLTVPSMILNSVRLTGLQRKIRSAALQRKTRVIAKSLYRCCASVLYQSEFWNLGSPRLLITRLPSE